MTSCLGAIFCCPCRTYERYCKTTRVKQLKHRSQSPSPPTPGIDETRIEVIATNNLATPTICSTPPPQGHARHYTWDREASKFRPIGWVADG